MRHLARCCAGTVRADSAFYTKTVLHAAVKFDVRFSVTARQDKRVRAAIEAIPDEAWQRTLLVAKAVTRSPSGSVGARRSPRRG